MILTQRLSCRGEEPGRDPASLAKRRHPALILPFQLPLRTETSEKSRPGCSKRGRKRSHCGQVERRLTLLVLHGGICSVGQQQSAQLGPPLLRRLVERRERPLIGGVDARVVLDQQGGDVNVLNGERRREIRETDGRKKAGTASSSSSSSPSPDLSNTTELVSERRADRPRNHQTFTHTYVS